MKPMLAGEADIAKLKYPLLASPKLDGLRGLIHDGKLLSRSLKLIPNRHVQYVFGRKGMQGLDGELIYGPPTAPDVYRVSTSAIMGHEGQPHVTFWVFDCWDMEDTPYIDRRKEAEVLVRQNEVLPGARIQMLEQQLIHTPEQLGAYENLKLTEGYEGLILRDPHSYYKYGRSSTKEGILLKLKRFTDAEATVVGFDEQMHNGNEKQTNELGRTKRSTAKAGLTGKGTLGALVCLTEDGVEFRIGTGMDDAEKQRVWDNRKKYEGALVKFKFFNLGGKIAPRHPVFLGWRDKRDMSK